MNFGYPRPHQLSHAPDPGSGDEGRAECDAKAPDVQDDKYQDDAAGPELPPQITQWMRRKKRDRRSDILKHSASWAVSLSVTSAIVAVTVWLIPVKPAALELWHEQAERMLEAIESPKPIELTADEPLVVPVPKAVSRQRWSNL